MGSLPPIPIHTKSHSLDELVFGMVLVVVHFSFHNLVHSTLLYSIDFSLPITICFKNARFSLLLSRESGFPGGIRVRNLPANAGRCKKCWVQSLVSQRLHGVENGPHSVYTWEIPWTEPGGL